MKKIMSVAIISSYFFLGGCGEEAEKNRLAAVNYKKSALEQKYFIQLPENLSMTELYQLDSLLKGTSLCGEKLFLVHNKIDKPQELQQNYRDQDHAKKLAIASAFYEQFQLTVVLTLKLDDGYDLGVSFAGTIAPEFFRISKPVINVQGNQVSYAIVGRIERKDRPFSNHVKIEGKMNLDSGRGAVMIYPIE